MALTPPQRRQIIRLVVHVPPAHRALAGWALTLEETRRGVPNNTLQAYGNIPCPWDVSTERQLWEVLDRVVGTRALG